MEIDKVNLKGLFGGIIAENRDHPLKNAVTFCNKCHLRIPRTVTCKKYPEGIPREALTQKTPCKEFVEIRKGETP